MPSSSKGPMSYPWPPASFDSQVTCAEPHIKISDEVATEFIDGKRNPVPWLVVGSRLQRIGESRAQRRKKLVEFNPYAAPVGLIATVDGAAGVMTLDLVGDADWPTNQIWLYICPDHHPTFFNVGLLYDLDELIDNRKLAFVVPTTLASSICLFGFPICDDMLLIDATPAPPLI
jgi:hypothetical protein